VPLFVGNVGNEFFGKIIDKPSLKHYMKKGVSLIRRRKARMLGFSGHLFQLGPTEWIAVMRL
jgi:hypothetical protein